MTRDEQILSLEKFVKCLAGRAKRMLPNSIHYEDLIGPAWVGAIRAVDRYDGRSDCSLATYADRLIWGSILDYLRSLDHLTRAHRKAVKSGLEDAPEVLDVDYLVHMSRMTDPKGDSFVNALLAKLDFQAVLADAIISDKERHCILRHYLDGIKIKQIALEIPCSESRVSQLIRSGIEKMRLAIGIDRIDTRVKTMRSIGSARRARVALSAAS